MSITRQQRNHETILPLRAAIYHAVHDIRGGVGAIAGTFGFNANTLQLKTNPHREGHNLNLREFEAILGCTRDPRLMDSLCHIFGDATWIDMRVLSGSQHSAIAGQLGELMKEVGNMGKDMIESIADGVVDDHELAVLEKNASTMINIIYGLIAQAKAMQEQGA